MSLTSFTDVALELGGQQINMSTLLKKAKDSEDDALREKQAFTILEHRKLLHDFKKALDTNKDNELASVPEKDLNNLDVANSGIVALAALNLSEDKNITALKGFTMKLIHSKFYDTTKIKQDCTILLSDQVELTLQSAIAIQILRSSLNWNDFISLYAKMPNWFQFIDSSTTQKWSESISIELDLITVTELVDIIFDTCKKKALSSFVHDHNVNETLNIYIECFEKILSYELFDVDPYLDKASKSLVDLEEVIL